MKLMARVLVVALAASACSSGGGTGPNKTPASISVVTGNNQTASSNAPVTNAIQVRIFNSNNEPLAGVPVTFQVGTGGGTIAATTATTDPNGIATVPTWTLGSAEGDQTLIATSGGVSVTIHVTAQVSAFNIELRYITTGTSPSQVAAFEKARLRWRTIIRGDIPDVMVNAKAGDCPNVPAFNESIDDVVIYVRLTRIDGPGMVLGSAGPCFIRSNSNLPLVGVMDFDTADLETLEGQGLLDLVILHEMGHVLGFGTIWTDKNLLDTTSTDFSFSGGNAVAAFRSLSGPVGAVTNGSTYTGKVVPVETTGGPGTAKSHWRENGRGGMGNELMTGFLNNGTNPLSIVTIGQFKDLGYDVDLTKGDPYSLPLQATTLRDDRASVILGAGLRLNERPLTTPMRIVDRFGTVVRTMHR